MINPLLNSNDGSWQVFHQGFLASKTDEEGMKKAVLISLFLHGLAFLGAIGWFYSEKKAEIQPMSTIEISIASINQPKMRTVKQVVSKVEETPALEKTAEEEPMPKIENSEPTPQENLFQEASPLKGGYQVVPRYPESLRKRGIEGFVLLKAEILTDGTVGDLWVEKSSGYAAFDESALKAVKQWKFTPARRLGVPVQSTVRVPVKFTLTE